MKTLKQQWEAKQDLLAEMDAKEIFVSEEDRDKIHAEIHELMRQDYEQNK